MNDPYRKIKELEDRIRELENVRGVTKFSDCMHDNCPSCNGTGLRKDGLGACIHGISCPCRRCTPYSMTSVC